MHIQLFFLNLFERIANFFLALVGPLAVLAIVVAGIILIVSGGSRSLVAVARRMFWFAIAGLALALLAKMLIGTAISVLTAGS